jgi:hypothetical protein
MPVSIASLSPSRMNDQQDQVKQGAKYGEQLESRAELIRVVVVETVVFDSLVQIKIESRLVAFK